MGFENIPFELQDFSQWILWRYEDLSGKKPTKVPYSAKTNRLASVDKPESWGTFAEVCATFENKALNYSGIGFVLTENDPFAFIDLDDSDGDQTAIDRQLKIYNQFDSYAEKSPSGKGLHIIIKGEIPSGRRRSFIEIYSSLRYMTMTGEVYRQAPIKNCSELLTQLWEQMGHGSIATQIYAGLAEAKETDEEIISKATKAANGEKFLKIFNGEWQDLYQSQSEADFALVDMVAFYTQNTAQISRIFRNSALGKRDKAKRQDYVAYMLRRCFDRMLPPVDLDGLSNKLNEIISKKIKSPVTLKLPTPLKSIYTFPPGLVGEIAQFIYSAAPLPVPEIALAGAIGLMAGIVGRSYNISGTGLNQYVLLLAPTASGKEAISLGIDKLMAQVAKHVPSALDFIGPSETASSQAAIKYMSKGQTSFVSVVGEFGMQLKQMAGVNASPHLAGLRRFLLMIFMKSGEGNIFHPTIYSDKEKNTGSIASPAFSLMCESTPETFYENLNEGLISEGFLPRFTIIEYLGKRPELNKLHSKAQPSFELVDRLSSVCAHSLMLNSQHKAIHILTEPEAGELFDKFNVHCNMNVNASDRDVARQLWSRGHLKALKLAGIIAVGNNPYNPSISLEVANWAINIAYADAKNLLIKFEAGEIGIDNDETKQLSKVIGVIKDYLILPWQEIIKYSGEGLSALYNQKIVPYSLIQKRLSSSPIFKRDKMGATFATKRAIKTLVERGDLQEISRAVMIKDFGTSVISYGVSNPLTFINKG